MPALVARLSPPAQKGSAMGAYSSTQFLGAFLGGLLGGFIAQARTIENVFLVTSAVALIWLLIAWGMVIPQKSKLISLFTQLHRTSSDSNAEKYAEQLASELANIPGVLETTVVIEENRTYLKVNTSEFDLQQAKRVAGIV